MVQTDSSDSMESAARVASEIGERIRALSSFNTESVRANKPDPFVVRRPATRIHVISAPSAIAPEAK